MTESGVVIYRTLGRIYSPTVAKKSVYIPDDLVEQLELLDEDGELNLSQEFQKFLRSKVDHWTPPSRRKPSPVRPLREGDIDRVIELWNQVDDEWTLTPMAERSVRRNLHETLEASKSFCLVADVGDSVVGFTTVALIGHPVAPGMLAEFEELTVDRAHRRQGLGRALAIEALRWIDNAAVNMIRAHVENDNLAAIRLFKSIGFDQDQVTLNRWPS
jgi:ribosomal protein S18 acetylase RimI-like enzyme